MGPGAEFGSSTVEPTVRSRFAESFVRRNGRDLLLANRNRASTPGDDSRSQCGPQWFPPPIRPSKLRRHC